MTILTIEVSGRYLGMFFGLPLFLWGVWCFMLARRFDRFGVRTYGTVVAYETDEPPHCPIVEFEDEWGDLHRSTMMSRGDGPSVGATIDIVYDPSHPDRANPPSTWHLRIEGAVLVVFSLVVSVLCWIGNEAP